jgi:hypothetical protein
MVKFIHNISQSDDFIKYYINNINNLYNTKKFDEIHSFIRNYIKNNDFLTNKQKNTIIKIYYYNKIFI